MHLELCDLTIEAPGARALPLRFHIVHLGLCTASAMIASPSSPGGSSDAFRCPMNLVSCIGPTVSGLQGSTLLRGGMIAAVPRVTMAPWYLRFWIAASW